MGEEGGPLVAEGLSHIVVGGGREKRSAGGSEVCERTRSERREVTLNTRTRVANDDVLE